ncbi:RecX family transcriptional regulator [Sporolactobacillus sp. THM19-2]|jgi:regulatory protein|uniref:RecX family transcriptional regulator n=1 Tax=Sporolactobacillus sp. THM19-2 TaxID=2511171 RepID=UPI001F109381|nr:RecX family transcriptional regulator [Sporolactobacillus sp. THM19-2]
MNGMPVIARIRTNNQEQGFYQIDVTEEGGEISTVDVHEDVLVHEGLHKGMMLSREKLEQLRREAQGIRAYHAGLRYLSYRIRSVHEMRDYLNRKHFSDQQITFAIEHLKEEKLLDDRQYALSFAKTRIRTSTKGPQMIYRELLQAGINQELAAETEDLFPAKEQLEHARKYLHKQKASVKNKKSYIESRQVLSRLLMQRGYSRKITEQVVNEINDFLIENERNALQHQAEKAMQKFRKFSGKEFNLKVRTFLYKKGFPVDAITSYLREQTGDR